MKKINSIFTYALILLLFGSTALFAENTSSIKSKVELYGFIRNYVSVDSREMYGGTLDLYEYMPKNRAYNSLGEDLNAMTSFRMLSLTSRLGLNIKDFKVNNTIFGGKVEADFYCMNKGGNVATFRLRQAYMSAKWLGNRSLDGGWKPSLTMYLGQKWHPMATDLPFVLGLESGVPFTPFNRSPQLAVNYDFHPKLAFTAAMIYQMQHCSTGISKDGIFNKKSSDYIKYSLIPEFYFEFQVKPAKGLLVKLGANILNIKPRIYGQRTIAGQGNSEPDARTERIKVSDMLTTCSPMLYFQYVNGNFRLRGKTTYASAGEHLNLLSGYGITSKEDPKKWSYAPLRSTASYLSFKYGKKWQIWGLCGYMKNLGTKSGKRILKDGLLFNSSVSSDINSLLRIEPALVYTSGHFTAGLEYNLTSAFYGKREVTKDEITPNRFNISSKAENPHCVTGHRIQLMLKYSF